MTTGGSMHSPDTHSGSEERNRMPITQSGSEEGSLRHRLLFISENIGLEEGSHRHRPLSSSGKTGSEQSTIRRAKSDKSGPKERSLRHRPLSDSEKAGSEKSPHQLRPAVQILLVPLLLLFTFTNSTAPVLEKQRYQDVGQALSASIYLSGDDGPQNVIWIDGGERFSYYEFNPQTQVQEIRDRKSTRLNSSHVAISYAVFCLK